LYTGNIFKKPYIIPISTLMDDLVKTENLAEEEAASPGRMLIAWIVIAFTGIVKRAFRENYSLPITSSL